MINVTKSFLPPIEEFINKLQSIWDSNQLTNNGPLVKELSAALESYLAMPRIELVSNGTLALQLAIKALGLSGEIITTPFTYVATASAIVWEGCTPVFADIDEKSFCINPALIEPLINHKTSAILATHVYGIPCDVSAIQAVADKHSLKVIYDAAHCFGVMLNGKSILLSGDIATLSFHATKLFHTAEGGAVICRDEAIADRAALMKKFGHIGEEAYMDLGINAKMSELHAAMGLTILPYMGEIITRRKERHLLYKQLLQDTSLQILQIPDNCDYNYSYFPVVFPTATAMQKTREALIANQIYPRR